MGTALKVPIGYHLVGNGEKKVIALHSWMDDAQSWSTTIPFLNSMEYSYAFMDVRGYGASIDIKGDFNSTEIANDVFNLADDLGWKEFNLIGHSMCGLAAQKAALIDKHNRIKKIVLVTPVSAGGFSADEETMQFLKSIVQNEDVAAMGYGAFTSNRYSDYWKKNRAKRHVEVTDKEAQLAYIDMWTKENFHNEMKRVTTPFLVLAGQYDHPQFKLDVQEVVFEHFQNVEFVEAENSGHFPMQETPVFLATTIEKFI